MKSMKKNSQWMVQVSLMAAVVVVLANTPLGMIQLPVIKATTVHIPVIIGALLLEQSKKQKKDTTYNQSTKKNKKKTHTKKTNT